MKELIIALALTAAFAIGGCKDKGKEGGAGDKGGDKALVAETDIEKAWLAWKESACKCTDFACASGQADARLKLEKKYPDSMNPKQKNVAAIITAANVCLSKATGQPGK